MKLRFLAVSVFFPGVAGRMFSLSRGGLVLALGILGVAPTAIGQATGGSFRLSGQVVAGGGQSTGAEFVLRGAIVTSGGGRSSSLTVPGIATPDFSLVGGMALPGSGRPVRVPVVRAVLTPDKLADLTWDVDIQGYVLEFSSAIGPQAEWQPVSPQPTGNRFTTPCQQPARFFRLREREP